MNLQMILHIVETSILKIEALCSSETLGSIYRITHCNNPEENMNFLRLRTSSLSFVGWHFWFHTRRLIYSLQPKCREKRKQPSCVVLLGKTDSRYPVQILLTYKAYSFRSKTSNLHTRSACIIYMSVFVTARCRGLLASETQHRVLW